MLGYSIFVKDSSEKYICDLAEEFAFFNLIRQKFLLVDDCGNKQKTMFSELLLATTKEGCPVFLETGYPLLAKFRLHKLWGGQEEYIVVQWGWGLRKDHGCKR